MGQTAPNQHPIIRNPSQRNAVEAEILTPGPQELI